MGTLTKKLHILKLGGTEETCNIYTTPEEVGGSPYIALEVDGQNGYVKLGNITDANATHLRVEKNGTTYAAWKQATIDVPTGYHVIGEQEEYTLTIPSGVKVIKVQPYPNHTIPYIGVTPNSVHKITFKKINGSYKLMCTFHNKNWYSSKAYVENFTISWSPEINEQTPTKTDY